MTLREQLKAELDQVDDEYLEVLHRTIIALAPSAGEDEPAGSWKGFLASTYGCTRDAPLGRADQGAFELRDSLG